MKKVKHTYSLPNHEPNVSSLCALNTHEEGEIVAIETGDEDLKAKFYQMGLFPGTPIEMFYNVKLTKQSPVILKVYEYYLGLRFEEAQAILVKRN
jgi:Fe2+ transport system protein FeoA